MDTNTADFTDLPVALMLEADQGRALVGLDLHGEFIPFAELKYAAVVEMLAAASDRQAQQVQSQPTSTPEPTPQVPQGAPSVEPQAPQADVQPQVEQQPAPAEQPPPAQPTEPAQPQQ